VRQAGLRSNLVDTPAPVHDHDLRFGWLLSHHSLRHSPRDLMLNDSSWPFCDGFPRATNALSMFVPTSHFSTALEANSGQLSERRCFGNTCWLTSRVMTSMIRLERLPSATSIASDPLVRSSITVSHYSCGPPAQVNYRLALTTRFPVGTRGTAKTMPSHPAVTPRARRKPTASIPAKPVGILRAVPPIAPFAVSTWSH
jgi:hypothetical protein